MANSHIAVSDIDAMTEPERVYLVIYQLAVTCATVANITRRGKPFKAEDFMPHLRSSLQQDSLHEALRCVIERTSDIPTIITGKIKE